MQLASFFLRDLPHHGIPVVGELWQSLPELAPSSGGIASLPPSFLRKGVVEWLHTGVEYTLVILSTISLVIQILKKK